MNDNPAATVLIVEDDINLNLALVETLASYGYATMSAYHGQAALELLRQSRPDVIVCDINMPVMDGYTFLRLTRADPELRLLPFIFLTAHSTTEGQRRAKLIGVEDYLSKPIDSKDLVAAIENALTRRRLMADEIERSMDQLRNRIVGLLQHEFRTPLTFILGYAEMLTSSDESHFSVDELRMFADAILQGGRRLQQLIESFLLMAELQTYARTPKHLEPANAWSLWNNILHALPERQSAKEARQPTVRLRDEERALTVNVDVRLIDEALRRLYEFVERVRRDESAHIECRVEYSVPYVGLTIWCSNAELPPLPPARLEEHSTMHAPVDEIDADLGLTVARTAAQLHGGKLTMNHNLDDSLTLTLWLPGIAPEAA